MRGNSLLRKFHMCTWETKLTLFQSYCSPLYCSQLWWFYKKKTENSLSTSYHNILKMFLVLSKFERTSIFCAQMNIHCFKSLISKLTYKFIQRLSDSENNLVVATRNPSIFCSSRIQKNWRHILYV